MKTLKILLAILLMLNLNSCGYSRFNNKDFGQFKISDISIDGEKKYKYLLKNNIMIISKNNAEKQYDLKVNLINQKESKIKNSSGKTTRYNLKLIANLELKNNNQKTFYKTLSVTSDYEVSNIHSDTITNEKKSMESNINKMSDEIRKYLQLISLN